MNIIKITVLAALAFVSLCCAPGCTSEQIKQAQDDLVVSQKTYAATTQATAGAKTVADALPEGKAKDDAEKAVDVAAKSETLAKQALDVAQAAVTAAANGNDPTNPAFIAAVQKIAGLIPSPYAPAIGLAIPLLAIGYGYAKKQYELGHAHGTIGQLTAQAKAGDAQIAPAIATAAAAAPAASPAPASAAAAAS